MPGVLLLFAVAALTVKQDGAELREGCEPGDAVVAKVASGTAATVRFAMNGCYAVDVAQGGKVVKGFLPGAQLDGVEAWDAARRSAPSVEGGGIGSDKSTEPILSGNSTGLVARALEAYKADRVVEAAGLLKDALAQRPDANVQRLLDKIQQELNADKTGEPLHSPRFVFRFDPAVMPRETARALLGVLEQEYTRISFELGCRTDNKVAVIVQSRDDYMKATGAAEWSGGQFDGRIRVALMEKEVGGPLTRRTLAHEVVHACLAAMGSYPAWLHEGLAQKLSGETLSEPRRAAIRVGAKADGIPKLANLSAGWSRMSSGNAALAYATSLYAVELYYQHHAAFGIQNLLRNPDQLERVMMDLDARFRQ
jgi:hypothetical protein